MSLRLFLLGSVRIEQDNKSVKALANSRQFALLAYLACAQQSHTRQQLAEFLWPEQPTKTARSRLRWRCYA